MTRRPVRIEELEPRVLLSGDLVGALALPPVFESDASLHQIVEQAAPIEVHQSRHEIVFIDTAVEDWETLVEDLLEQNSDERTVEIVQLSADRDGLLQIAEALSIYTKNLDAVHVISHGNDRGIQLGGTFLDQDQLMSRGDLVSGWGDALSRDADLLLYGCDLAGSTEGKALIDYLAGLTGADVAASTDLTGASILGGDWDLEHTTGSVESFVIVTAQAQQRYGGVLGGTSIWVEKDVATPQTREFNGTTFGAETDTAVVGEWEIITGAEAPTRDEKIVLGTDKDGVLTAQIYSGGVWSALPGVTGTTNRGEWAFDVAYSSQSGDALIVWGDTTSGGLSYATWDGTTLSTPVAIGVPAPGEATHLKLAADPNSDEIMVVGSIETVGDFAMVWDGTSFVDGQMLTSGAGSPEVMDIDVVYEGQSGRAMIVYGDASAFVRSAIYDGGTWTNGSITPPDVGLDPAVWTSIAADPNSDQIALVVETKKAEIWLTVWNGTSWEASVQAADAGQNNRQQVAVAFESTTGDAIAAYSTGDDEIRYQTWTSSGGWSGELIGPDLGASACSLTLDSDPYSDTVMLSLVASGSDVMFLAWDGSSWGAPSVLETDGGTSDSQPYLFLWEQKTNTAPVLTPSAPTLPSINEDEVNNSGELISNLLGSSVSDPDSGAVEGIAITSVSSGNGTWEYRLGVGEWTAVGSVSDASALLLRSTDQIRFVPDGDNGDNPSFDFRAWDQTTGTAGGVGDASVTGGKTAFSTAMDTATLSVSDVNDAPTLIASTPVLDDVTANSGPPVGSVGTLVSALIDFPGGGGLDNVTDVDTGAVTGIAVTSANSSNGTWHYTIDGGATWLLLGSPTTANARLLSAEPGTRLYFESNLGFSGSINNALRFRAWDQTTGSNGGLAAATPVGGTTAFSTVQIFADITVTIASSNPSGSNNTVVTNEDASYVFSAGDFGFTDTDGDLFLSVIITTAPGAGTLRNGASVLVGGETVSIAAIDAGDLVFSPANDANGAPFTSFTFQVVDDSALLGADTDLTPNTMSINVTAINDAPILTPSTPSLTPISEDEVTSTGDLVSDILGASVSDVDGAAQEGIAITSITATNGAWEYSINGGSSWASVPMGVAETTALLLRDNDRLRFVPNGQQGETATFDFRAWDQTIGTAGTLGNASLNGGTTEFSSASDTASITVSDLNDAPTLNPSSPSLTPITEDETTNSGDLVSSLLGGAADVDGSASEGIAITSLVSSNGAWQYSIDGGTNWNAVGVVSDSSARLLRDSDLVRFVPDGLDSDSASFDFRVWDQTTGSAGALGDASTSGGTSAFSTSVDTASITVSAVNDAPILDNSGAMTITNPVEDDVDPSGSTVAAIILTAGGDRITDSDAGASEGFAVVGVDDSNGTWEYSTDGGSNWTAFGVVSDSAAVLLDEAAHIRFVPDASYTGPTGNLDFRAWDQSSGSNGQVGVNVSVNGGTTAFSTLIESAAATVIPTNDAPVLTPALPSLPSIGEDDTSNGGELVSAILGTSNSDVDLGALEGIAITNLLSSNGTWEYSTDNGTIWNAVPLTVSDTAALLLDADDLVRFVPDTLNGDAASFDFRAWDQTSGSIGTQVDVSANGGTTAFSVATDTASITVNAMNDAPVLDNTGDMSLSDVFESGSNPAGDSVATLIGSAGGDRITDVDLVAPEGIAVVSVDDTNGTWQYSTDGGTIWTSFGAVTDATAVLLDTSDLVRFVPTTGYVGSAGDIEFRAWDQSAGSAGQTGVDTTTNGLVTPFSVATETASLNIIAVNFAPVLNPSGPSLTTISEDETTNAGDDIASLLGGSITDLNLSALEGIAITTLSSGNGDWEYSINGGTNWNAVGAVSSTNALLLREGDRIRFVPDGLNADSASFEFLAWDQTSGIVGTKADVSSAGGNTAFSAASDTATIVVSAVNDAGSIGDGDLGDVLATDTDPAGATVSSLFDGGFTDVDASSSLSGIAVVTNTADPLTEGEWQYSSDGGSNWLAIGSVGDDANALVLAASTRLRFVSVASFDGVVAVAVRGLDNSYTGSYSTTAGGFESRANVDASVNGGTNSIAAATADLSATVIAAEPIPLTPEDFEPPEIVEIPSEEPSLDDPDESSDPESETPSEPPLASAEDDPVAADAGPILTGIPLPIVASELPTVEAVVETEIDRDDRVEVETRDGESRTALDVLRDVYMGRSSIGANILTDMIFNGRRGDFLDDLDAAQEDIIALSELEVMLVGSSVAVTSGLSVGYVLWMTRGGLLIASLLSSLPAWKLIDPIPVLARFGLDDEDAGESLGSMVDTDRDSEDETEAELTPS